ncbi:hypothetical protein P691DRAFT_706666 [Macrolepiota fuliginosa MF-IS2]|uniref:P-loop containing nucleoside triphosphate hydrolase protein n=1 Tax=Macrolepiota fuliginosa MF-IS2 TaxID=1400762 RepID=A0A9P5XDF2_9AGAR|nr:hypothetical protein P691DRAFT_706666 [Macrolepiota fuliginosa MF-IS2]
MENFENEGEFETQDKIVLILCGLIASGKSTFAEALQIHFPQFRRCNQDDLGSRQAVERAAREFLDLGYSVCIDRTNFDAAQRSHWIKIAHEFPGTLVWVIVFDTPYEICAERLRQRTSHPTIQSAEQGLRILSRFAHDFRHPDPREGYDHILYLTQSDTPISRCPATYYIKSEISAILRRVRGSPVMIPPPISSPIISTTSRRSDFSDSISISAVLGGSTTSSPQHGYGYRSPASRGRNATLGHSGNQAKLGHSARPNLYDRGRGLGKHGTNVGYYQHNGGPAPKFGDNSKPGQGRGRGGYGGAGSGYLSRSQPQHQSAVYTGTSVAVRGEIAPLAAGSGTPPESTAHFGADGNYSLMSARQKPGITSEDPGSYYHQGSSSAPSASSRTQRADASANWRRREQ